TTEPGHLRSLGDPRYARASSTMLTAAEKSRDGRLLSALLAIVTLALYAPTLGNDFVNLDDPWYVHGNPFATEGWRGILLAFFESHLDAYYPVTHAIYTVVQTLFGTSALAHHAVQVGIDRKSTRLNSSHVKISYAVFCLKKKKKSKQ